MCQEGNKPKLKTNYSILSLPYKNLIETDIKYTKGKGSKPVASRTNHEAPLRKPKSPYKFLVEIWTSAVH